MDRSHDYAWCWTDPHHAMVSFKLSNAIYMEMIGKMLITNSLIAHSLIAFGLIYALDVSFHVIAVLGLTPSLGFRI
jgi:hypothetical protein